MLYLSLITLLGMLVVTNYFALRSKQPVSTVLGFVAGFGLIVSLMLGSILALELGMILFASVVVVTAVNRRRLFVPISLAAFALVLGINARIAWRGVEQLREEYRFESLESRLPERGPNESRPALKSPEVINKQEAAFSNHDNAARVRTLRNIHEDAVAIFINQPNFGRFRGMSIAEWGLNLGFRTDTPIAQPGVRSQSTEMLEKVGKPTETDHDLAEMHDRGIVDFLKPTYFGYFKDRRHVAGFQSHQFSEVPDAGKKWKLQALDLMGLVVHEKPVVYLSENLPRMDELRKAPMRELNAFELAGLKALREGEDIFIREMPDHSVRMLGALRAMKQCIDCHGGARGDLLGAFSYELRKD
jgi:hypothetical protein